MRAKNFLSKKGKKYFRELVKILESRGITDDSYAQELSILADLYADYDDAIEESRRENPNTKKPYGYYNFFDNGTVQVNAFFTKKGKALDNILKLSPKFGLTPGDFKNIKDSVKEEPKTDPLNDI